MMVRYNGGFVRIETESRRLDWLVDRVDPAGSLRKQAEENRARAARLLEHAALMDQAADRLE